MCCIELIRNIETIDFCSNTLNGNLRLTYSFDPLYKIAIFLVISFFTLVAKEKNWDVYCRKSELNAIFFSFARKSCTTRYQADGVNLDQFKGYEKLKNTYQKVTLIIPKSKYDYVMNKCKNRGCDGMCPSVIMMFSSSPTQPQQQISNIDPLEQARLDFTAADKELNTLYRAVMSSLNPDKQTELKKEQIAWIKKKEATAVQEANVVGPKNSPAWTIKNLEFTTRLTKERIGQLQKK